MLIGKYRMQRVSTRVQNGIASSHRGRKLARISLSADPTTITQNDDQTGNVYRGSESPQQVDRFNFRKDPVRVLPDE